MRKIDGLSNLDVIPKPQINKRNLQMQQKFTLAKSKRIKSRSFLKKNATVQRYHFSNQTENEKIQ